MTAKKRRTAPKKKRARLIRNLPALILPPEDEPEPTDRFGRPTKFKLEYVDQARVLCEDGATDAELADHFGVACSTLYLWRNNHPELAAAMKLGKEPADNRLERTAYEVAVGYTQTVRVNMKLRNSDGSERTVEVEQQVRVAPNPDMLRWLLKNRRPDDWRDKTETEVKGEVIHLTPDQAKERLRAKIEHLRQLTGETKASAAG